MTVLCFGLALSHFLTLFQHSKEDENDIHISRKSHIINVKDENFPFLLRSLSPPCITRKRNSHFI